MTDNIKTRFCPSPTGLIHLGNARTALFNALLAKHHGTTFLLRIEDTDKERSKEEFTEALKVDLKWINCDWQEGPDCGGPHEPYHQSKRDKVYDEYYQTLIEQDIAYPCFCTEEQLALMRKVQRAAGQPPRYDGTCRNLTPEQIKEKEAQGKKATLRFKVPESGATVFEDLVKGQQTFNNQDISDFIIRRTNGTSPFMFCNAIDDSLMGTTHVLRGDDHLTNTPRQLMILRALKLREPLYGHMSIILGQDGKPLSKRNGSQSIEEVRNKGYLPLAIINYLARLGHYYTDNNFLSFDELAQKFDIKNLSTSAARYDEQQLNHWQKEALMTTDNETLWQWMGDSVQSRIPKDFKSLFIETIRPNITFPNEALDWAQTIFSDELKLDEQTKEILTEAGKDFLTHTQTAIDQHGEDWKALSTEVKSSTGKKGKQLFLPLRVTLTGKTHGPELAPLCQLLGKDKLLKRCEQALQAISQ